MTAAAAAGSCTKRRCAQLFGRGHKNMERWASSKARHKPDAKVVMRGSTSFGSRTVESITNVIVVDDRDIEMFGFLKVSVKVSIENDDDPSDLPSQEL